MYLIHGTGISAAEIIVNAIRSKKTLSDHDVVWHCSSRDRIYFWGGQAKLNGDSVDISRDLVQRTAESAMYTKALMDSRDKNVCILIFHLENSGLQYLYPDPDADGMLPSYYMTVGDFNRCIQIGIIQPKTVTYDELYCPELRWEYLATMRAVGRRFPTEGIADKEPFWKALKKILFSGGVPVAFERLFTKPIHDAQWKLWRKE